MQLCSEDREAVNCENRDRSFKGLRLLHPSHFPDSVETSLLKQDASLSGNLAIAQPPKTSNLSDTTLHLSDGRIALGSGSSRLLTLPELTKSAPLSTCRVSVIIPVRDEEQNMSAVIKALAHQVDRMGDRLNPDLYEILVLANNCTDRTVEVVEALSDRYSFLNIHVIDVVLPQAVACVGKARQMVMDEAYRRFALVGLGDRIIASTDGDTEVVPDWIAELIEAFDKGIDALGGRILTRRAQQPEVSPEVSLYYLRRFAHACFSSQIGCLLDPQVHDCWPRHSQFYGANMAVLAEMYGRVGGMPLVRDEEDVALYRRLQQADAKIRHSLAVRVQTSARQVGRATGGLAELLATLSAGELPDAFVEAPVLTEARVVMRRYLRQVWTVLQGESQADSEVGGFVVGDYAKAAELLARSLGLPVGVLRSHIEDTATFGELLSAIYLQQIERLESSLFEATTEISLANMHLRQSLNRIQQRATASAEDLIAESAQIRIDSSSQVILKALQQVQAIPLFPPAY